MENQRLFNYAENDNLVGVVEVLSQGADINWQNPEWVGQTALHVASANGHTEVVKTLLFHPEIDPNIKDDFGWTPLHGASFYGNLGTIKELLKVPQLNYNAKAKDGWTAMHSASYSGAKNVVDELIQLPEIDLGAKTDHGDTFLDLAFKIGNSQIINLPSVVEYVIKEVNTLNDQLRLSRILSDTNLAENYRKQVNISKRLNNIGSQLRDIETVLDPKLQEIGAILLSESTESKGNAVVKDADNSEVGRNAFATSGIDFDDLKNTPQSPYFDDKFTKQYGNEFSNLGDGNPGEFNTMQTNVTSGAIVTLSILLVVFAHSCIQYHKARTVKRTFGELWNIKSIFWTITCGMITWILNLGMQALTLEGTEGYLSRSEDSVNKLEMPKDEARTAEINKEMKNHYEDQLKKMHTVYEAGIRDCKSEFVEKLKKLQSETERLKTEMTSMKKTMSMLEERSTNVEANRVKSIKRVRSVGQAIRHRQDSIIFDNTDIVYDKLKNTV